MVSISEAPDDATIIAKQIVDILDETERSEKVAELYVKGCWALHVQRQIPKIECGAKFAKIIRDLKYPKDPKKEWHSGYYWDIVKAAGFTRSSGGEPTPAKERKISSRLLVEDPTTWPESPFYEHRLPLIQFLQEDRAVTDQMIIELQRNYEQKELEDGTTEDDRDRPREWKRLFSEIDVSGHIKPWPKEEVADYLKLITDLRAKMQKALQRYMDERRAVMPWMIWPLKCRADIISKAFWGKQYYVMFKRKDQLTPKKLTQFEESEETVADYLNWVATDAWKLGYCEFIPCPHCIDPNSFDAKEKNWDPNRAYLLEMFPFDNGTWQWHCATCGRFYPAELMKQQLEMAAKNVNGTALIYLQRAGVPIPKETEQVEVNEEE